jgi:hypothetical protein
MSTIQARGGHNVPVTTPRRARTALLAALVVPALVLTACGTESEKKSSPKPTLAPPTGDVEVPDGVTLTEPGALLKFGETANVAYSANPQRGSALSLTVNSVQQGRISDLAAYQLSPQDKQSRPYYMRAVVKNVGTGDLSRIIVPLYGVDSTNALVQPTSFSLGFKKCPSTSFPVGFTQGKSVSACLVYLVPNTATLTGVSYRPQQKFAPIIWKGTITPATPAKSAKKPTKKQQKQQAQP